MINSIKFNSCYIYIYITGPFCFTSSSTKTCFDHIAHLQVSHLLFLLLCISNFSLLPQFENYTELKHYYFILSGQNELSTNRMRLSQHHFFSKRWPWTILGFVKQIEVVIANAYSGWQDNPSCRRKTIFNLFYIGKTRKKKNDNFSACNVHILY